ncbi:MAG: hypothetical protein H0V12_03260, partial [Chloroflexi bacterium]|nr:hypothetical protein [Chloroflexota bacterium]
MKLVLDGRDVSAPLGQGQKVPEVARACLIGLVLRKTLDGDFADRLEHPVAQLVAAIVCAQHEAVLHQ